MAARRCGFCGVNYPAIEQFRICPIHDEVTTYRADADPDPEWKVSFERLHKQAEAALAVTRLLPLVSGVSVVEENGQFFVPQIDLQRAGLRLSRMMPDQFYLFELDDGWVYETQGWDDPRRRWWVARVAQSLPGAD